MSKEIPYDPIGKRKEVTQERMREILARRAPQAIAAPPPKRMKWRTVDENIAESNFGYRVLRCTADGKPTGRFIAFRGKTTDLRSPLVLGGYDSWEDARTACDAHFAQVEAA